LARDWLEPEDMWKHLLVPVDFSECGERAIALAVGLAKCHGAKLTLVHVSPLPPNLPPTALVTPRPGAGPMRIDEYTTHGALERLHALAAPLRKRGLELRTLALTAPSGDVAGELLGVAAELGADALVVGTHGRTGLSHLLLGSVAEKIIRRASVPVITIRSHSPEAQPTREEREAEDELAG